MYQALIKRQIIKLSYDVSKIKRDKRIPLENSRDFEKKSNKINISS